MIDLKDTACKHDLSLNPDQHSKRFEMPRITRRRFLKISVLAYLALALAGLPRSSSAEKAREKNHNKSKQQTLDHKAFLPLILKMKIPATEYRGVGATYVRFMEPNIDPSYLKAIDLRWEYNWGHESPDLPEGIEYYLMIYNGDTVDKLIQLLDDPDFQEALRTGKIRYILGFNEPELEGQANLSPEDAAKLWYRFVTKLEEVESGFGSDYEPVKLISPAVTSLSWLREWAIAYEKLVISLTGEEGVYPRLDGIAFHYYGAWNSATAIHGCKNMVAQAKKLAEEWQDHYPDKKLELLLTEFAHLPCWPEGVEGSKLFIYAIVPYLDEQEVKHAWFNFTYHGTEPWWVSSNEVYHVLMKALRQSQARNDFQFTQFLYQALGIDNVPADKQLVELDRYSEEQQVQIVHDYLTKDLKMMSFGPYCNTSLIYYPNDGEEAVRTEIGVAYHDPYVKIFSS